MKKGVVRKSLVFGIIMLFVGTSVVPSITGNIDDKKQISPYLDEDKGGNILLYNTYDGGIGYENTFCDETLPTILQNHGYSITLKQRTTTPQITNSLLAGYDELWLVSADYESPGCFIQPEIDAILNFRQEGKGLLLMSDHGDYCNDVNQIANLFGVNFYGEANHYQTVIFDNHPLFSSVNSIYIYSTEAYMSITPPVDVVATCQGDNLIAVFDDGNGRIVFDRTWLQLDDVYINTGDTPQYVRNIADWLSGSGDVIFSDDFNDNIKDYTKWTEIFTDGTWWEQNQRTEFECYESGDGSNRYEGIQSSAFTVSLSSSIGIDIFCDFITHIDGDSSVGQPRVKITDSSGTNWIEITYERFYDRTKFRDSNDGETWTILENNKEDGSWTNQIQIFSDRYYIKMDSAESGVIYDSIFSNNPTLKVQIFIIIGGSSASYYLRSGFDNVLVQSQGGNQGDLTITNVKPIQVVWDPSAFVVNKITAVKIFLTSTFNQDQNVPIKVIYNYGQNSWTETILIKNGENWVYLPDGPSSNVNTPWGHGNEFLWTSAGTDTQLKVIVDPDNVIPETIENNNLFTCNALHFIYTKQPYKIFFQSWKLPWFWDSGVSFSECMQTATQSDYFISSTYPLNSNYPWAYTNPSPMAGGYIPSVGLGRDLLELSLAGVVIGVDKVVGVVTGTYLSFHFQGDAIGVSLPNIDGAVIIKEGWWVPAAHEILHTYDNWRRGNEEEYSANPPGNEANGFWLPEHDIIDSYNWWGYPGLCFMGSYVIGEPGHSFKYTNGNAWRDYWVCNSCYEHLLSKLQTSKSTYQKIMFISGFIDKNNTVELNNMYTFDNRSISDIPQGNYEIKMLDENGGLIAEVPFDISFNVTIDPYGEIELNSTAFSFTIPYPELKNGTLSKIQMLHNDTLLAERNISKHAPEIKVITPNGGETLIIGKNYTIQLEGNDLDGDILNYCVLFSSDNGGNWSTLTMNLDQTEYTWNTTNLETSNQCKIRVIANDGFNTKMDDSDGTFSLNYPSTILIGLINNINETENSVTFNANLLFWLSFKPFRFKFYSSNEVIEVSKPYQGRLAEPFILGQYNAIVLSDTTSVYHPFRDLFLNSPHRNPKNQ